MGYKPGRAGAIISSGAILGPIIPPSTNFIILGSCVSGLSITKLFMIGLFPGIFIGLALMIMWFFIVRIDGYHETIKFTREEKRKILIDATPAFMMPVLLLGGIRFGVFTPTEGGAFAAVYAILVCLLWYREIGLKDLLRVSASSARTTAAVMMIVATATAIGYFITLADIPQQIISNDQLKYGDAIYVDLDGNGVINENDMSRDFGHTDDPEYIAGLNLGFQWKDLSVNAQFTGAWNVTRYLSDVFMRPFQGRTTTDQGGLLKYHLDHTWTKDNPSQDAEYPRATQTNGAQNYATSTLYEKDAKYLRLKTLEVAYDFHFGFMRSIGLNQLQLAFSGYNLFTITPYIWGDPETRASASPSYPLQRTYTVSLKLGF